jgi:hypothetical protein
MGTSCCDNNSEQGENRILEVDEMCYLDNGVE